MFRLSCSILLIVATGFSVLAPEALAQKKTAKLIKANKEWVGSVEEKFKETPPAVITNAKDLEKVWKAWKVAGEMPMIDFKKEIVIVTTTVGSKLKISANLDDEGNLRVFGIGTKDLRPGFRYVLATVNRDGVKTVNGKPLSD